MLNANVLPRRQTASFQPNTDTLRKNISGSMEGEATQKANTGASGTPPIKSAVITGITPHEQNGLIAPIKVAKKMDNHGDLVITTLKYFEKLLSFIHTANGMVTNKYGQT
jgi:hypothetical protein